MDNNRWTKLLEEFLYVRFLGKIVIRAPGGNNGIYTGFV
jgi:hypothetical protein